MLPVLTRLDRGNGWRLFSACPLHLPATLAAFSTPAERRSRGRIARPASPAVRPLSLPARSRPQRALDRSPALGLPRARQEAWQLQMGKGRARVQHDYAELEQALGAFVAPGEVFELRLLHNGRKRVDSGYFDHPAHAATAIAALQEPYAGIYFTPNPVNPDIAARSYNRIAPWASLTTLDGDVLERR